ncbi:MAG TPA: aldehyde dehydrogenase family protein [Ignavibacteria bacterium]|nr:aldehyde dehydrogenase family protein [Ignavibacteria bacterium]
MNGHLSIPKMYKLFIGGKFTRTESERYLEVLNPSTGTKLCNISRASRKDVRNAVLAARIAQSAWASKSDYERGQILYRLAEMLETNKERFISEIKLASSVSTSDARKEINACIDLIIYYAGFCDKWVQLSGSVNPVQSGYFNFSIPEPVGVVAVVLPSTLNLLPLISRICPVIASGNSCVVLINEINPLPTLSFAEVIATSDIPGGVINLLSGQHNELIPHLCGHMDVNSIDASVTSVNELKQFQELASINIKRLNVYSSSVILPAPTGSQLVACPDSSGKNPPYVILRERAACPDSSGTEESLIKFISQINFFNKSQTCNLENITKFTELKTVWHTSAL